VAMTAKAVKDALVVPVSAVFKNAEGADYVVLAGSDEKAHQKTVQVGIRNADLAQILSGINAGDPVITTGGYALPDGTQVKIEKPAADEKVAADKSDEKKDPANDKKDAKDDKKDPKAGGATKPAQKDRE
jgi:multidrug efflux system membrane fusion protein